MIALVLLILSFPLVTTAAIPSSEAAESAIEAFWSRPSRTISQRKSYTPFTSSARIVSVTVKLNVVRLQPISYSTVGISLPVYITLRKILM